MFGVTSRYSGVETDRRLIRNADGSARVVAFKRRRFLPLSRDASVVLEHLVVDGDRLDLLAASYLGDPTEFWSICDANSVMDPRELEEPGRVIAIATEWAG